MPYAIMIRPAAAAQIPIRREAINKKKHDEKWMASFWDWAVLYESGMTIMEIVEKSEISRRTCYRYKAYYEELKKEGKYNFDKQTC